MRVSAPTSSTAPSWCRDCALPPLRLLAAADAAKADPADRTLRSALLLRRGVPPAGVAADAVDAAGDALAAASDGDEVGD